MLLIPFLWSGPARAEDVLQAIEQRQRALFERLAPSVVFISAGGRFGSGLFVSESGLVLTNAHVVGDAAHVDVVTHAGKRLRGQVVERAAGDIDLALVQTPGAPAPVPPLGGTEPLRVGSWVAAIGHGRGGIWTFNVGMVSNIYPEGSERPVFQTQIPLNPGSSGGPIVDRTGRVVGIVTAGLTHSNSINFGIEMSLAFRSLAGLAGHCDCLVVTAPSGVPVFVDGAMVGAGPRVVAPVRPGPHEVFAVVGGRMRKVRVVWPEQRRVSLE